MMPTIFIMKEGTENAEGKQHIVSNINACLAVAETVRSTLGPRGMDKLIVDGKGKATITNDGATIMNLLDVVHPAARALVDIARSQDSEVGDGTTSVVILSAEILRGCKRFVEDGVHPTLIIEGIRIACRYAVKKIESLAVKVKKEDPKEWRALLEKCAATSLSSKLIAAHKSFFAKLVVDAVLLLDEFLPLKMIGIKKLSGGAVDESFLVSGVAFKKAFSYAGFEMQPKKYKNPKIAMLNIELELKGERDNAEIRLDSVEEYQNVVDAEWAILYGKLEKLHAAGVQIVLSKLPIGDVASQYFADRNMFCAGRIPEEDLQRTMMACGGCIITSLEGVPDSVFGTCENFEEIQIGKERFNVFSGCPKARTCTFILRGGAEQFIEETERSLHDAIMIVRRAIRNDAIVAGGGAIDMELACYLRDVSRTFPGKNQLVISTFARAFEIIPRELCTNAGFDSTNVLNKLRQKHSERIAVLQCVVSINEASPETSVKLALLKSQASHQTCSAASGKLHENLSLEYDFTKFNVADQFEINVEVEGENLPKRTISFPVKISPVDSCTNQVFTEDGSDKPIRLEISYSIKSPGKWYGIDINNEDVADNFQAAVWEPALVKINIVKAASEAVCLILGTDQTIKIPKSAAPPA